MGLFFATPLLLAGIAAVAVPIALHMMMRRKPVKLEFPALRFLQQRNVVNRRRLRLRHLLLLLARIAAIVLFVLALSRPTILILHLEWNTGKEIEHDSTRPRAWPEK